MKAYKLVRLRKEGSLGSLFINRKAKLPVGVWMPAEEHPTKGYAFRPGWHCTFEPNAPHLSAKGRMEKIELKDVLECIGVPYE